MNKYTDNIISKILGDFWISRFTNSTLISWVKEAHYRLTRRLFKLSDCAECSVSLSKGSPAPTPYTLTINVADCSTSIGRVGEYSMSGMVQNIIPVRTILIPNTLDHEPEIIVSGKGKNRLVFVHGINMRVDDTYIELYLPASSELVMDVVYTDTGVSSVYVFDIIDNRNKFCHVNHSYILDTDVDLLPEQVSNTLWRAYTQGLRELDVRSLISASADNDIADTESYVQDVWREGKYNYVLTTDSRLYRGVGSPLVSRGSRISKGDFIFYGVYSFNRETVPHPKYIPSLTISTAYGYAEAINKSMPTIPTSTDYIPAIINDKWIDAMKKSSGHRPLMIDTPDNVNPLEYVIKRILPRHFYIYSIPDSNSISMNALDATVKIIQESQPSAGACCIYRRCRSLAAVCVPTIRCSASVYVNTCVVTATLSPCTPIVNVV